MAFQHVAGRVTLVTGAARGIGRAIAAAFLDQGALVALCDVDADLLHHTARDLGVKGGRLQAYELDVADAEAFESVFARVEHELGPVDVLVNNAGIMPVGPFLQLSAVLDRRMLEVNLFGVINGMRAALPRMERRHRGHVVNIASVAGKTGVPFIAVYAASKHAVVGLTESVRAEMADSGIGFSYVLPAFVDTELTVGTGRLPFPPVTCPSEVADAVVRAVQTGKVDVYVPRVIRLAVTIPTLLPRVIHEPLARLFRLHRVFRDVDEDARASYRDRILAT
ncbi:MAG: SDR family oxidoreductase [Deltaproteobacteria bacterium]|nr:SDR family oxidoreductase [Deltaproteobacteria bacterium]MBW2256089.1 SDR family oxidoreductase [Deltaproteobacteria bacterium]